MSRIYLLIFTLLLTTASFTQKKPLHQTDYESWKIIKNTNISENGSWISYEVNPQKGDGMLYIHNPEIGFVDSVARGYDAKFSGDSKMLVFKIKPGSDTIRKAKLAEVKKENMPKDSLGIYNLQEFRLQKVARVKSFKLPEKGSDWFAYLHEEAVPVKDTAQKADSLAVKKSKRKHKGAGLIITKAGEEQSFRFEYVMDYDVARNGELFGFIAAVGDSIDSTFVYRFNPEDGIAESIFRMPGESDKIVIDDAGNQLAFLFSPDTSEIKNYNLAYWNRQTSEAGIEIDSTQAGLPENWRVSIHRKPHFSRNGEKLYFGTAPKAEPEPEDTLLKEEKVQVDIWKWNDPLIQPHQHKRLESEKKQNFLAVYYPSEKTMLQLADDDVEEIRLFDHGNTEIALGHTFKPYAQLMSWDGTYRDYYTVNTITGEKQKILTRHESTAMLSPGGKYALWYLSSDSSWYVQQLSDGRMVALTRDLPYNFYNELNDRPKLPGNYGMAGWTKGDEFVLIYDRYDIWKFDPQGKADPYRITGGFGRENEIRFRYLKLDRDATRIDENIILSAFDFDNKQSGFYKTSLSSTTAPKELMMDEYRFTGIKKAENAEVLLWQKETFDHYPDLYMSKASFEKPERITTLDRQRDDFLWGDVQLVNWTSADGETLDGLLYTPENIDPTVQYPMLVYFYERSSDRLHSFRHPAPSRSTLNPSYCVSNGYVVFVPDIPYLEGYPGESAFRAIVSGTLSMTEQFPFIDARNMGLQGQSWGGYQIAYLITRTNLFKAAMAGAPVSNMTSAYGGIRWGSGVSRMFQYEKTQSRIGGTLWEKPLHYIENSPLFYADKIETPLLIMHNDDDGAVPWYQGIEMYMAMRRLQKPAWMLTYNNEGHNLTKWPNRMDLDIRMYQFFDHYLKNAPAPVWLKEGIPATEKGKTMGYETN